MPVSRGEDWCMKTKMMVEPEGKAREEVKLESSIPLDSQLFDKWKESWISGKDFKKWRKAKWPTDMIGEYRHGKILRGSYMTAAGEKPLKGDALAFRSFILDGAGGKKKLPMVLYAQVKKYLTIDLFSALKLEKEQEQRLAAEITTDSWAPVAVWHPKALDGTDRAAMGAVLEYLVRFSKTLFMSETDPSWWPNFTETEVFKE